MERFAAAVKPAATFYSGSPHLFSLRMSGLLPTFSPPVGEALSEEYKKPTPEEAGC